MSDALAGASMISGQLSYYRMMDGLRAACARRNYENELTYLQACNDWLLRNLQRQVAERNAIANTANAREAEYERRIAALEQKNSDLEAKVAWAEARYKERNAQAAQEAGQNRDKYNRLVEDHNDVLRRYKTLLMSVSPEMLAGNPRLLVDYKVVRESGFKPEGG